MRTVNLHRLATTNVGDLESSPCLYFDELADVEREDICGGPIAVEPSDVPWREKVAAAGALIIGGGGLLACDYFEPYLALLAARARSGQKLIIWGAGHNRHERFDFSVMKPDHELSRLDADLIGVRDADYPYDWVPCASCMSPLFDQNYKIEHELVIYAHSYFAWKDPGKMEVSRFPSGTPYMRNDDDFERAIPFLGSGETVLTDSYHGVYWATLLGRRVVGFANSSKFFGFKHPVPICDPADWRRYSALSVKYPEALGECRSANKAFAQKAFDLLGIA